MAKPIIMPKLDMTMEEGEINAWLVQEGDVITKGQPLFEVLSEKAAIEVESNAKGTVLKILYKEGETVGITKVVAIIGKPGEDISGFLKEDSTNLGTESVQEVKEEVVEKVVEKTAAPIINIGANGKVPATPAAKDLAAKNSVMLEQVAPNEEGKVRKQQVQDFIGSQKTVKSTPLAAKIAADNGIDLNGIDTDKSRIYSADVMSQMATESTAALVGEKLTGIRKISADRLTKVWNTIPMVTNTVEVDVSKAIALCERLNGKMVDQGVKVNITDILIKIMATAMNKNPEANVSLQGDMLIRNKDVNIGMAVSIDNGLIVPVLKNVDKKGLSEINAEKKALATKARENSLKLAEMTGGSITISNIGMYGVDIFTPIINMPESTILGVGRIAKKPVVVDDEVVIRPMMWLSLTFDHRALDGVAAMKLLGSIRDMIEEPDLLIL